MKSLYKNLLTVAVMTAAVGFTGCKKFLDVNESPNGPESAQESLVLPSTQGGIGMVVGNNFQVYGGLWSEYWTQNTTASQYKPVERYQPDAANFDRPWGILYNIVLKDIEQLIAKADQEKYKQYAAIGYIEKAYVYQLLTDAFGNVPLKETMQGADNLFPHYDEQKVVYDSILVWAAKGVSLANNSSSYKPGTDDIVFKGDMNLWKRFGNTLLLRASLRLSEVDAAKAQAGIAALFATSPTFLTSDAKITYTSVGGNQNPLYAESVGLGHVQNLIASKTAINAFKANSDPRINYFYLSRYTTGAQTGQIFGHLQGDYDTQPGSTVLPAYPSTNVGGRAGSSRAATSGIAPVILMSAAEAYFLQAEAVARGWATGIVATLFQNGITASFTATGLASSAPAYIAAAPDAQLPLDKEGQIKAIITQKYYAMCGTQGFEAWSEYRRTGYPNFLVPSVASTLGSGKLPQRFLYPNTEVTRNTNFPGQKLLYDRVWWDVK
ncbi:SusD/RagB family nutrient-binding outer membrane lipoprotein [Chitinophagaceae bacterium LB-8]|uniref:SusD/RagB family nutrient-binding outer membrane lipoprotein n=1 Tax=Paraflavisolibacter caeni TaxID=2982496 RepID=A0A9X3B8Q0_9BACT|nr:SusD/RagB family nutrient-binding outer membrane lipoprotein [Paraflavisolibacter caeni]MCU7551060.1 SusD/RagB family nutrient-binding outer membrane lipoprotein [Paraflavisolibacter caeni]